MISPSVGHRFSAGALEEAVNGHPDVVESAIFAVKDELKGHVPVVLLVLQSDLKKSISKIEQEVIEKVRADVGAVAAVKKVKTVEALPKTRSGKILRNVMRKIADGEEYTLPGTIEDASVIEGVKIGLKNIGYPQM